MNILVDAYVLLHPSQGAGGAGQYLHALLKHWNESPLGHKIRVVVSPWNRSLFDEYRNLKKVVVPGHRPKAYRRHFRWADVYFAPLNGLWPRPIPDRLPVVAVIHDLQHLCAPQFFKRDMWDARNSDYGFAILRADALIAISESERKNFIQFFRHPNVEMVSHGPFLLSSHDSRHMPRDVPVESSYVVFPAVPWPHKNHYSLLAAWKFYCEEFGGSETLVLTGATSHSHSVTNIRALAKALGIAGRVRVLGHQDAATQIELMQGAKCLLFPSLYEGFGLPVLEAMALGTPVLASDIPAIREVGDSAVAYLDSPLDPYAIACAIHEVLSDSRRLEHLASAGLAEAKQFSVKHTTERTLAVLERQGGRGRVRVDSFDVGVVASTFQFNRAGNLTAIQFLERADEARLDEILARITWAGSIADQVVVLVPVEWSMDVWARLSEALDERKALIRPYVARSPERTAYTLGPALEVCPRTEYTYFMPPLGEPVPTQAAIDSAIQHLPRDESSAVFLGHPVDVLGATPDSADDVALGLQVGFDFYPGYVHNVVVSSSRVLNGRVGSKRYAWEIKSVVINEVNS